MDALKVGDVVNRIDAPGAGVGMVAGFQKTGTFDRVRVMVPYDHPVQGMILHEVLWDRQTVRLAL